MSVRIVILYILTIIDESDVFHPYMLPIKSQQDSEHLDIEDIIAISKV